MAGLRLEPLEEFIALHQPPSWISALGSQTETDKGLMEKERHRKGEKKRKDKKKRQEKARKKEEKGRTEGKGKLCTQSDFKVGTYRFNNEKEI